MSATSPPSPLHGATAIVTGAAVGLGAAFARALGEAGTHLVLCDVRLELAASVAELDDLGVAVVGVPGDVSLPQDVQRVVEAARARFGGVDVLVNNAAVFRASPPTGPWAKGLDDFEAVVGVNLRGAFLFGRAVIPELVERGGGAIVNVSSDHVLNCGYPVPWPHDESPGCPWAGGPARRPGAGGDMDVYDATKWALNGLTLNWAWALRDRGVRVNGLCVGATDTPMMRGVLGGPGDGSSTPARPPWLLEPEQVASVLVELLEEGPSGRTGENVGVWPGHPARLTASSGPLRLGSPARAPGWA